MDQVMRVIDTFVVSHQMVQDHGELSAAPGLWVVIETCPAQLPDVGTTVTIRRPDGSERTADVAGAEIRHGVAAIRFTALDQADIPRLSEIRWRLTP